MSIHKIGGLGSVTSGAGPGAPVAPVAASTQVAAVPGTGGHSHGTHFNGALFRQQGQQASLRRGPTVRMPLRSVTGKRATVRSRNSTSIGLDAEEDESSTEIAAPEGLQPLAPGILPQSDCDDNDSGSQDGQRDERRFERQFQMAARADIHEAADGRLHAPALSLGTMPALPRMESLAQVVQFVHASTRHDPSGKSLAMILRQINAAVLRDEIKLPVITKVAEARAVLIDVFGQGASGEVAASLQSVQAMLPLWLINLSRRRTALQQSKALAILCVPRHFPMAD